MSGIHPILAAGDVKSHLQFADLERYIVIPDSYLQFKRYRDLFVQD